MVQDHGFASVGIMQVQAIMRLLNLGVPQTWLFQTRLISESPRVRKIRVRNSGAGNGCVNFMGAWENAFFLQEKPMSIKFLVLGGGGVFWVFFGGGGVPILFLWARGFF